MTRIGGGPDGLYIDTVGGYATIMGSGQAEMQLDADELRWLVLVGGPAAMHEIEGAIPQISDRATRRCPR